MAGPSKGPFRHRSTSKAKSRGGEADCWKGQTLVSPPAEPGVYLSESRQTALKGTPADPYMSAFAPGRASSAERSDAEHAGASAGLVYEAGLLAQQDAVFALVHDSVHAMGGSISAEHGVGQLKRDALVRYKEPVELPSGDPSSRRWIRRES